MSRIRDNAHLAVHFPQIFDVALCIAACPWHTNTCNDFPPAAALPSLPGAVETHLLKFLIPALAAASLRLPI
ncbi:MAG: hypothetical protein CMJ58_07465 [Planctomycetaceae bacterium]|nr:hypothetical protein [Planctomycetaceae bacterium]